MGVSLASYAWISIFLYGNPEGEEFFLTLKTIAYPNSCLNSSYVYLEVSWLYLAVRII